MTTEFPTGQVALVFTDLEGSSELSERYGATFEEARMEHFGVLRKVAARWHGYEVETAGDSVFMAFAEATYAVQFAVEAQQAMAQHQWPAEIGSLRVRIGMHTGQPFIGMDRGRPTYRGPVTNRAARVQAAGHGGQILISNDTYELVQASLLGDITLHPQGVHRLKGVGEEFLWQVCHPALQREFPPLNTLDPQCHNLPALVTPLIGREEDTSAWRDLLIASSTRLFTLVGLGGIGKSRLALQLAELCVQDFADGVWWVSLDEVRSADNMLARVAQSLRLYPQAHAPIKEPLWNYLRDRKLLLVLDNTEQIPDAANLVNELLQAAPRIKCLVTSRRALGLRVEQLREVLPLPPADAQRLFVERARALKQDFEVADDNEADVAELCRRLEGIPLALELAASRIVAISPREILGHLNQRFRILQTRAPDLPPRQRALRGAIGWSYDLLNEDDKALFAELAVFVRGFTFRDAEAVCDPMLDVFEGVEELRRQSLLRSETEAGTQQTRFFMMESVRAYAAEKLADEETGMRQVQQRHARHYLQVAQEYLHKLRTHEEARALAELDIISENLRAAMDWAQAQAQQELQLCAELALALGMFLSRRGLPKEAARRIETGLDSARQIEKDSNQLYAQLLRERAGLHHDQRESAQVRQYAGDALTLFQATDDLKGQAEAYNLLGLAAKRDKAYDEARQYFNLALRHYQEIHAEVLIAIAHNNLGITEWEDKAGNRDTGALHLQEALRLRRKHGDQRGLAETLNNLGVLVQEKGDQAQHQGQAEESAHYYDEAQHYYTEALQFETELRSIVGVGRVLYNLSEIAEVRKSLARACRLAIAADYLFCEAGSPFQRYSSDLVAKVAAALSYAEDTLATLRHELKDQSLADIIHWALADETLT